MEEEREAIDYYGVTERMSGEHDTPVSLYLTTQWVTLVHLYSNYI